LFSSFRPEDQQNLVIAISGGLEVAVQQIARVEQEIVMIRGRVAGQAENGRLFILPYARINSVYVNRAVQLEEVELFSPTVSMQRKEEVAKIVAALAEKARQDASAAEKAVRGKDAAPQVDLKRQLEELREKAGFGASRTGATPALPSGSGQAPSAAPPGTPATLPQPSKPSIGTAPSLSSIPRPSIPSRPTIPRPPPTPEKP
jgi:regulator of protease activity HflC (stomatin/prohibitin superfamily)